MRVEIRLAGSGGQGLITAAIILAEAAVGEGKHVCQTQSYGPEARGGACKAEVVLSDRPVHYPKTEHLDVLVAMTQEACDRYFHDLKDGGLLIVDADLVPSAPTTAALSIALTRRVREALGRDVYANLAALGALVGASGVVGQQVLEAAVAARVPRGTEEPNRSALLLGLEAGREAFDSRRKEDFSADA